MVNHIHVSKYHTHTCIYIYIYIYITVFLQKGSRNSDLAVFISPFDSITKIVVSGTRPKQLNI